MKNNVAGYRRMFNLKQSELAEQVGLTSANLSLKERGKIDFRSGEMIAILNIFKEHKPDITLDDIFLRNWFTE